MHRPASTVAVAVLCLALGGACAGATTTGSVSEPAQQDPTPEPTVTDAAPEQLVDPEMAPFSRRRAMRHVRNLAGRIGVRARATKGERRGATYVKERFTALGYRVRMQRFDVDGRTSRNVVAWWPGALRYPIVLGGHMDTVPSSPGANDNASGVAVILEIARLARYTEHAKFLRFVAFGSEEYGSDGRHHVGSQVYVNRLGDRGRKRLAGMISVDMVADGRPLLVGSFGIGPRVLGRILYRKLERAHINVEYHVMCDCSDNGPFEHAGIPGAYAYSGPEPNYHSSSDTVGNLVPDDLERSGRAIRAFVKGVDRELVDRLRRY
ncbi:MAG TPA: M28 family peptidase [Actinomycetota bacterium]|nr:M28 family peptidase [Actinomycetota bacterium]